MVRLLHTADWQIGKLFGQFETDEAALLADARFKTIERLARLATEQHADMILVAGDVFDAQGVADKTIHRLFGCMAAFAGPWVMIPGNHDAALAESVWTRAVRLQALPGNVHLCLASRPLILAAQRTAILPAPLTQRHTYADLTEWFATAETPAGMMRIGLAHGCVQGFLAEGIDSPNPIAADRAEQAGLDYLALGDWHGTKQIGPRCWYSGTPETDRFRSNASGQALLVDLPGPGDLPSVRAIATGHYHWHAETLTLQIPSDIDNALQRLASFGAADIVHLQLSGQTDLKDYQRLCRALEQARGHVRGLLADMAALRLAPSADDISALHADGYLGEVIEELRAGQDGPEAESCRDALALLASMLGGRRGDGIEAGEKR